MQKKFRTLFGAGGPYIVFALCLVAAGVLGYQFFFSSPAEPVPEEPVVDTGSQESEPIAPRPDSSVTTSLPEEAEVSSSVEVAEPPAASASSSKPSTAKSSPTLVSPLAGKTIAAFSADALTYNEALEDWRTHNGIDIAAEEGTPVCASADGTVLSVSEDPLMGVTVVLEHDGGFVSTYACLGTEVYVSAGDEVLAGQNIGAVGSTAAGESAEPHLHFSVTKDGQLVDPSDYLP
ncbi:MAG: peptidoglycan DD-metalloendopeptidase family protein [Oscillospiraceae bacterium]